MSSLYTFENDKKLNTTEFLKKVALHVSSGKVYASFTTSGIVIFMLQQVGKLK